MQMRTITGTLVGAAMLALAGTANAALIVTEGVSNTGTSNVIANACDGNVMAGTTVQGCFNSDHLFYVNFTSDEQLTISGGQATIQAVDGAFSEMTISLDSGDTFSKLVLNINALMDGFVTFVATPGGEEETLALDGDGQNFFTITGMDFTSIMFSTTVGLESIDLAEDLRQVRIGGIDGVDPDPDPVPEPTSLALLGLGLLGAGLVRRRR